LLSLNAFVHSNLPSIVDDVATGDDDDDDVYEFVHYRGLLMF